MFDFDFVDALFWFSIGALGVCLTSAALFAWLAWRAPRGRLGDDEFRRRVRGGPRP